MRIPKKYGHSRIDSCPFCGKQAVIKNKQEVPVCQAHKESLIENFHCVCGEWLDVVSGKWGPYFKCLHCGNINFRKGLEMNEGFNDKKPETKSTQPQTPQKDKKPVTVRSDEVDFLDW